MSLISRLLSVISSWKNEVRCWLNEKFYCILSKCFIIILEGLHFWEDKQLIFLGGE